jgi:hypothetical protein
MQVRTNLTFHFWSAYFRKYSLLKIHQRKTKADYERHLLLVLLIQ